MKPFKILLAASAAFIICIPIAYHNTASLGYDKQDLIYYSADAVEIMDWQIEYNDIKHIIYNIKEIAPDEFVTI